MNEEVRKRELYKALEKAADLLAHTKPEDLYAAVGQYGSGNASFGRASSPTETKALLYSGRKYHVTTCAHCGAEDVPVDMSLCARCWDEHAEQCAKNATGLRRAKLGGTFVTL